MMDKSISILDKLKNKSKASGIGYQLLLQLLCQEEFLRRLSKSDFKNDFVLKGGLFIYILTEFKSRATVDMDFFLRNQTNDMEKIVENVKTVINTNSKYDFIKYEIISVHQITVEKEYPGVSIQMIGKIGNTRTPVNIDFGVGDVIVPKSETRIMKSQLAEFEDVEVSTYSLESTISEKFDAILQRFELTSRMKDFYDIWYLALNYDFDGETLSTAVKDTLENRGTLIEVDSIGRVIRLVDNETILIRWQAFCLKMNIELEFIECINVIEALLNPIINLLLLDELHRKKWLSKELRWVNQLN